MGYIRHDAMIAIGSLRDAGEAAALAEQIDALRAEMGEESEILIGPIAAVTNLYTIYAYLPDGSKEGWDTRDRHDEWRAKFAEIVNGQRYWDVLAARFGGDDYEHVEAAVMVGGEQVANLDLWT